MVERVREEAAFASAATQARSGTTTVVTVEGEPGAGTSWLVQQVARALHDFEVIRQPDAVHSALSGRVSAPTLMVIDNAHDLDPAAAESLAARIHACRNEPLLIVVAGRVRESSVIDLLKAASSRDERGRVIVMPPLTAQQCVELAAEHDIVGLDPARAELLAELTDGNPHHLVTVFDQLGQSLHAALPRQLPVPAHFDEHLARRLSGVPPAARAVLEIVAVAEQPLSMVALGEIARRTSVELSVDGAIACAMAVLRDDVGERELTIPSALVAAGIARSVNPARSRALHAAIAESLRGWDRLKHRLAATEYSDSALAAELEFEADVAARSGRYPAAARMFSRAAGVSGSERERERRLFRAAAFAFYADDAELAGSLAESVARCVPSLERSIALGGIGYLLGDFPETLALVEQAVLAANSLASREQSLFVSAVVASLKLAVVNLPGAIEIGRSALEECGPASELSPGEARVRLATGFAFWIAGKRDEGLAVLRPLLDLPATRPELADALAIVGQQQFYEGQDVASLSTFDRVVESARVSEAMHVLPLGLAMRAQVEYSLGQWDAAMLDAQAVLAHTSASRNGNHDGLAHAVIAMITAHSGQIEEARRVARVAQRLGIERPLPQHLVSGAVARAVVERAAGSPHAVIHALTPLGAGVLDVATRFTGYTGWRAMSAEALIALRQFGAAESAIDQLEAERASWAFGYPNWLRGLIAEQRGERRQAADHFRRAVDGGDQTVTPLAHAWALRSLADALAARGDVVDAAVASSEANGLLMSLGLELPEPQDAELTSLIGWATLTPRERDTAMLVSEGMLNREIGTAMHVSVKTVEKHVANALAKLGMRSRRDLERRRR